MLSPENMALMESVGLVLYAPDGSDTGVFHDVRGLDSTALNALLNAARAEGRSQGEVEGWRLVPVEPSEDMLKAANREALSIAVLVDDTRFACERATYRAAVAASPAPPPPVGTGWRPMSEAPRDGTPILAFNPVVGVYNTAFTTWFDSDELMRSKPGYEGFPCGFWSTGVNGYPFGRWDCQPTHWQPLPPPPDREVSDA